MLEIIPAILTSDTNEASKLIASCEGEVHRVQIDIIDGVFAPNKTIDPSGLGFLETSLGLDFHLMVKEPIHWIEKCVNAGADRIIGQIEMMQSQSEFIRRVQATNLRTGLAIDLDTPVANLDRRILAEIDVILVMSVKAGFGGQKFENKSLAKISELNEIRKSDRTPFRICVDGGESEDVIDDSYRAGADEIAIGRRLFRGVLADNIKQLIKAVEK